MPLLLLEDPAHSGKEPRLHGLGKTSEGRRLHISFTVRQLGALIRVISARDMHRKERAICEQADFTALAPALAGLDQSGRQRA